MRQTGTLTESESDQLTFDASFLARLRRRDPATCTRLFFSFAPILEAKLRYQFEEHDAIEDVRNETFYRVFDLVDRERVREPERFGSFVCGVCSKVALEYRRKHRRTEPLSEDAGEPPDPRPLVESLVADEELRKIVMVELAKLPREERSLIHGIYVEGRERPRMAQERGVTPGGLNVRLCRALKRLRTEVRRSIKEK